MFRKSEIAISAAVILALGSKCYKISGLFFTLGLLERMIEDYYGDGRYLSEYVKMDNTEKEEKED